MAYVLGMVLALVVGFLFGFGVAMKHYKKIKG